MHLEAVNSLGDLRLPRNSVVKLTDRPEMNITVYFGRRETKQLYQLLKSFLTKFDGEGLLKLYHSVKVLMV